MGLVSEILVFKILTSKWLNSLEKYDKRTPVIGPNPIKDIDKDTNIIYSIVIDLMHQGDRGYVSRNSTP